MAAYLDPAGFTSWAVASGVVRESPVGSGSYVWADDKLVAYHPTAAAQT